MNDQPDARASSESAEAATDACPMFHNGHSARRSDDGKTCEVCGGVMCDVPVLRCDCEPHIWDDGSVSHEDDCAIYPWCPHEAGAFVCTQPCRCRCNGCTALALGHIAYRENGGPS